MRLEPVAAAARGCLDLLLPRTCAVCDRLMDEGDRRLACGRCWARVRALPAPQCDRCGHPRGRERCGWCALLPPYVRAARSVCWIPGGTGGAIVHALKYAGWKALAPEMGAAMARLPWPADVVAERTALVPLPLAASRERERGYNQSTELARTVGRAWGIPVWDEVVERSHATRTQTGLTPEERRSNVSGAFRVRAGARSALRGAHLVLVDDVITTGATFSACARALFAGGARIISLVTFGRAPALGDRP